MVAVKEIAVALPALNVQFVKEWLPLAPRVNEITLVPAVETSELPSAKVPVDDVVKGLVKRQ